MGRCTFGSFKNEDRYIPYISFTIDGLPDVEIQFTCNRSTDNQENAEKFMIEIFNILTGNRENLKYEVQVND